MFYPKYVLFPTGIITTIKLICLQCSKFRLDFSILASYPCHPLYLKRSSPSLPLSLKSLPILPGSTQIYLFQKHPYTLLDQWFSTRAIFLPRNIWPCLEIFLIVTKMLPNILQCIRQSPTTETSAPPNVTTLEESDIPSSEHL